MVYAGQWSLAKCYNDVIMGAKASQITSFTIVFSAVYSKRGSKKTPNLRVTGLCVGNSPVNGEFPAQRACINDRVLQGARTCLDTMVTFSASCIFTKPANEGLINTSPYFDFIFCTTYVPAVLTDTFEQHVKNARVQIFQSHTNASRNIKPCCDLIRLPIQVMDTWHSISFHCYHINVSIHWQLDCLLTGLPKPLQLGLCERNPPVTQGFPLQRASSAKSGPMQWRPGWINTFIPGGRFKERTSIHPQSHYKYSSHSI